MAVSRLERVAGVYLHHAGRWRGDHIASIPLPIGEGKCEGERGLHAFRIRQSLEILDIPLAPALSEPISVRKLATVWSNW